VISLSQEEDSYKEHNKEYKNRQGKVYMEPQTRQNAIKTRISSLLNGKYVVNEGWEPNHILFGDQKLSRVNIIGVVVSKNQNEFSNNTSIAIDDGSGRINVRSFEENIFLNNVSVGEVVVLIGRPREYSNEIYIMPEIVKAIEDKRWVEVRKLELGPEQRQFVQREVHAPSVFTKVVEPPIKQKESAENVYMPKAAEVLGDEEEKEDAEQSAGDDAPDEKEMTSTRIIKLIKENDSGSGADFETVIGSAKDEKAEEIIQNLLKNGDIFELKPGKLKVLE
jgi:RPA family protein